MNQNWSASDLAYFAGIIDGEGCFCLHTTGKRDVFACDLSVGNTDPRLAQWIQERFGGSVLHRKFNARNNCKDFFHWRLASKDLDALIPALLPYLVLKKDRAELMLAYRKTIVPRGRGQRNKNVPVMGHDAINHRLSLREQMTVLNKRGAA